jgi:hypothetical protein
MHDGHNPRCPPVSVPFWAWPLVRVGQSRMTTVQAHVRWLTMLAVLGVCRQRTCRWSPFDPAAGIEDESLPWGSCGSSMHEEGWASHPPTRTELS